MTGIKRKQAVVSSTEGSSAQKKPRKEGSKGKMPAERIEILETATDSDPIVESDTTSQSGMDDGASWPSEDDGEPDEWAGVEEDSDNGGVKLAEHAASTAAKATPAKGAMNGSSSKEAHAKQKVEKQERKAAKPNADTIARSKKLWEKLRRKSHVPKDERKLLVTELFEIITGRVKDFVFKHDSVRVIQTALKYAKPDQRKMIARELKGEYKTLAESKYAKFLIGKMLVHGDEETRDLIVPEFYGHVRRLIKHPEASWILDDMYRGIATPTQKAALLREWYGAEYALFKSEGKGAVSADLKMLLTEHPEKRTPIMRSLHDLVNLLVQKKTTGFTMLHDAMLQYFLNIQHGSEEMTNFIELLKGDEEGDLLKNLAFTKSGARVVSMALAYGNAKDRKQIIKTYKGTIQALAYDTYGHQVMMTIYDVVDDTKLVSKSIFPELVGQDPINSDQQQNLLAAIESLNARIALLYPFSGHTKAVLSPEDIKVIREVHDIRDKVAGTSKKDPEVRRKELIGSLSQPLLSLIASSVQTLVATSFGCQFISEVLLEASGDRVPAMTAVANIAIASEEEQVLLGSSHAGRMLKRLVDGGRFNTETKTLEIVEPPLGFHNVFYEVIKGDLVNWATSKNSFVVVGFLEAPGFSKLEEMKSTLGKSKSKEALIEAAGDPEQGDSKMERAKKRKKGIKEVQIIQWFVEPEARVEQFDKICEVQSDKASTEDKITSRFDGVIKKLHYEAEDVAQVGKPLCDIDVQSNISPEDEAVLAPPAEQAGNPSLPQQPQKAAEQFQREENPQSTLPRTENVSPGSKHSSLATPAVREILKAHEINIADVHGSGKDGRVLKEDVQRFLEARNREPYKPPEPSAVRRGPNMNQAQVEKTITLTPVQSQMFKTMTRSLSIPHFLYADEVDITSLTLLRRRLNAQFADNQKLSFLHFVVKAVSLALEDFPLLNARVETNEGEAPKLVMREKHNIGMAMDTAQGLLVPNIKNVSSRSILDIAAECTHLQTLGKGGKLSATDLTGGTITVSNIGSIGGTYVAPVLVQSEVAILGMGKARTVPAFDKKDQVIKKEIMNFSWSADHRVVDGATMARMGEKVKTFIEEPDMMMARLR